MNRRMPGGFSICRVLFRSGKPIFQLTITLGAPMQGAPSPGCAVHLPVPVAVSGKVVKPTVTFSDMGPTAPTTVGVKVTVKVQELLVARFGQLAPPPTVKGTRRGRKYRRKGRNSPSSCTRTPSLPLRS